MVSNRAVILLVLPSFKILEAIKFFSRCEKPKLKLLFIQLSTVALTLILKLNLQKKLETDLVPD